MSSKSVWVTGFHQKTNLHDFKRFFQEVGRIRSCVLNKDEAYFEFKSQIEAEEVVAELNNHPLLGRKLTITLATIEETDRIKKSSKNYRRDRC